MTKNVVQRLEIAEVECPMDLNGTSSFQELPQNDK
jgi:hypothetical protein